jgi:Tfp pilus assembly major pilin PilA
MSTSADFELKKRAIMIFLSLLFLIVVLYLFSDIAMKLYEKYFVNDHREVVTYLEILDLYNNDSTQIVESSQLKFYSLSEDEYDKKVKMAQDDLQKLIDQTVVLTPPQGFSQHKDAFLVVLNQRMKVLSFFNNTKKSYEFQELNNSVRKLNQCQEKERRELLKAFKNREIKYKLLGDGSIRYWFKGQSPKSLNRNS